MPHSPDIYTLPSLAARQPAVYLWEPMDGGAAIVRVYAPLRPWLEATLERLHADEPLLSPGNRILWEIRVAEVLLVEWIARGFHYEADRTSFCPVQANHVRPLTQADMPRLVLAHCSDSISGQPGRLLGFHRGYGAFVGEEIVAWANIISHDEERSTVGNVYTRARWRRQGHATAVVSACTADILARAQRATYSCDVDNLASQRVCERVGFIRQAVDWSAGGRVRGIQDT
jgi:RimJ/RimL family protein N-acetyltransferase